MPVQSARPVQRTAGRCIAILTALWVLVFGGCGLGGEQSGQSSVESSGGTEKSAGETQLSLADTQGHYGRLFGNGGGIIEINVEIAQEDWEDILSDPTAEEYHAANITVNGLTAENVGFRTKGFSSLTTVAQSDSDRYGFRVKMDKYVEGQTLEGLDELVLNGSFADPSYMREYLTYAASACLEGITPYVTYANLSVNGELFGLYLCIEAYDDSFSQRYSQGEDTRLYKADSENCTLLPSDDAGGFDQKYGAEDTALLKELIETLNSSSADNLEELESVLDVSSVLKAIAVNTVMGNYDSYSGSKAHNYYLLYTGGKFHYVGWDYNMSIGGFNEDNGASVTVDIQTPVYNIDISQRPLIEKLLAVESYYEEYESYLKQLMEYFSDFEEMVGQLSQIIRQSVEQDPTAFYTLEQYDAAITASDTDLSQVKGGMGNFDGRRPEDGFSDGNGFPGEGELPQLPEGEESGLGGGTPPDGQLPEGAKPPADPSDMENDAGRQEKAPDGNFQPPQGNFPFKGDQLPDGTSLPEGMTPPNQGMGGFGGGMISNEPCSIVDYILQRIANIQSQLDATEQ